MSEADYCPVDVGICCYCGTWFKRVKNFVDHARRCADFQKIPEQHKVIYERMLNLREGALL